MEKTLWICAQFRSHHSEGDVWDFQGIFSTEELAVAACRTKLYFVAPVVVNEQLADHQVQFPGAYYPLSSGNVDNAG